MFLEKELVKGSKLMEKKFWKLEIASLDIHRIAVLSFFVLVSDVFVVSIIYPENPLIIMTVFDVLMTSILGIFGVIIANYVNIAVFDAGKEAKEDHRLLQQLFLLGLVITAVNTYIWLISYEEVIQYVYWVKMLTPLKAIFLSLRAAIIEEVIFRVFLFSLLLGTAKRILKNNERTIAIFSSLITSVLFAFMLHGGTNISFAVGVVLSYVFYKRGLVPVMLIHFVGDVIPLVIVSLRIHSF
ncbi:MAG: CPBP family intramembrane glutamic endopeptidase [Bacillota bacterium]